MQSSVASTKESRRAGRSSTMGLVGQPILQEDKSVPSSMDFNDQVPEDVTQKSHATAGQEGSTLSMSGKNARYQKGANSKLDKEYDLYKTMRLWRGNAMSRALSEEEINLLVCLERKERETPMKLSVQDVSTLTEFSGRISLCRQGISREKTRIRKEREREKLREAAKKGCSKAKRKLKNQKVAGAKRSANYRQKQKKKARA